MDENKLETITNLFEGKKNKECLDMKMIYKERNFKMKNKTLLMLLVVILFLPLVRVKGASMDSYIDWNLDRSVFAHQYRNGEDHITNLAMITAEGKVAYCIEPGVVADKASYYSSTTNILDTKLSGINTKKISLIGYYGYGYEGHYAKEYYMAAQELIWREMGVENVWWTDSKEGGNILNIDNYKNEILKLVNNYEVSPSFEFKYSYVVGEEAVLKDKNNVLEGYEVIGNNDVTIDENKLTIKIKEGVNSFTLRRKNNGLSTKFYYKDGYQTIGSFEFPYNYEKNYKINRTCYGKITINKLDSDTKSKKTSSLEATLEGAEYGLYDKDNNLIESKRTDEHGMIVFDNLTGGSYKVKEITPSTGYNISKMVASIWVGGYSNDVKIDSYEKIITNKIKVKKVLDDKESGNCTPEEGIIFHLYNSEGNFIKEYITDENGDITFTLPYGKYLLKQYSTKEGIDYVKDKEIEVVKNGITQDIVLVNHKIEVPIVEEVVTEDPKENIEVLPDTGNNNILYTMFLMPLGLLGIIYEKKYI